MTVRGRRGDGLTKLGGWNEMNIPAVLPPRNLDGFKNQKLEGAENFSVIDISNE